MDKEKFGIMSPVSGLQKNIPIILALTPDNINVLLKDGKILRRKMREATLLDDDGVKVQTPDANPIIHYHHFIKRLDGSEYLLAFTKAHIYHWNPTSKEFDLKFTCSANCENWETVSYNDKVIATNNVDKVLVWDTTGDFEALDDTTNGIEYSRGYSNETNVDETSAKDQKVLKVASTSGYAADDKIIIDRGGDREEEGVVDSVQTGESLTLKENLTYDHTVDAKTTVINSAAISENTIAFIGRITRDDIAFVDGGEDEDTITTVAGDFVAAGFTIGCVITVSGSASNDGEYTITGVVSDTLNVVTGSLTAEDAGNSITIFDSNPDTITDSGSGFLTAGFKAGDLIIVSGSTSNNGTYAIDSVVAGTITLISGNNLVFEAAGPTVNIDAVNAAGQKVLNVTSTTGFSEDEFVTINAGGDRAETRKIYTIQDGVSLTFTVDLTYTHTQAQGDEVVGSAGQEDKVEEYTSYYLTKAKHLTVFENYLIVGNTYEHTSYHFQRARWNSIGEEANWLTGTRGSMEVGQSDKITGFGHYQGFLIIFKEGSYFKVWLVGIPYIFNKIRLSKEIGCQCGASIINDSKGRLYWYSSEGTFKEISVGTISDDIQTDIIAKIQPAYVELIKSAFINETEEVLWSIPVESDKNNTLVSFKEGKWLIIDSAVPAFGEFGEE